MDEADDITTHESFIYDVRFGMWLNENGWEFYDSVDRLINLKAGNDVESIVVLYDEYKKENPEP